ncbi:MAG: acyl-CoA dehydrogenase family protein [Actinomycetota bacterium]|nr:acyl-CoA dehydrogenase family protein [Actinomycetota bacterium]
MTKDPIQEFDRPELGSLWHTTERESLLEAVRKLSYEDVLPTATELDRQEAEIPDELISKLAEIGLFGVMIPQQYGGLGLGVFEYCMVSEELARSWMSVGSIIARGQGLGTQVSDQSTHDELMARSAKGDWIGAIALSEPNVGSDLASVETEAVRDGDHWILTGEKKWCGNALSADFIQVLAKAKGEDELVALLVRKERGTFPDGVTGSAIDKIGYHGIVSWNLTFDHVKVSEEDELTSFYAPAEGTEPDTSGGAFHAVQHGLNIARVQTAARAVGLARAAVEDTTVYLQTRQQFGHPIGDFQVLRFELATMAAEVEQARAFYRQVAHDLDAGESVERETGMVKLLATEMAVRVTNQAMQLHGGNGYSRDYSVERYWRDARLTTIFEGTSEIQRRTISNRILPRSPLE